MKPWHAIQLKLVSRIMPVTCPGRMGWQFYHAPPKIVWFLMWCAVCSRCMKWKRLYNVSQTCYIQTRKRLFNNRIELVSVTLHVTHIDVSQMKNNVTHLRLSSVIRPPHSDKRIKLLHAMLVTQHRNWLNSLSLCINFAPQMKQISASIPDIIIEPWYMAPFEPYKDIAILMTWGLKRMAYVSSRQLSRSNVNFIVARTHAAAACPINESIMQKC